MLRVEGGLFFANADAVRKHVQSHAREGTKAIVLDAETVPFIDLTAAQMLAELAEELVSGHSETMEYTNGVMEMFRIAMDWGKDKQEPKSTLVPGDGTYSGPVDVRFETSEPAAVYYTTDGSSRPSPRRATSRPTSASPVRSST